MSVHIHFRNGLHPVSECLIRFCDVFRVVLHFCLAFPGRPLFPESCYVCVGNGLLRLLFLLRLLALPIPLQRDLGCCAATGPVLDRLTKATLTTRMSEEPLVLLVQKNFASHTRPDSSQKTRLTSKQTCMLQDTRTLSPTRDGSHRALRDSWPLRETALQLVERRLPRSVHNSSPKKKAHAESNSPPQRFPSKSEAVAPQQHAQRPVVALVPASISLARPAHTVSADVGLHFVKQDSQHRSRACRRSPCPHHTKRLSCCFSYSTLRHFKTWQSGRSHGSLATCPSPATVFACKLVGRDHAMHKGPLHFLCA